MQKPVGAGDLWCASQTAWGMGRSEGEAGMAAVLFTIRNRWLYHPRWMAHSVADICNAPFAFQAWQSGDVTRQQMLRLTMDDEVFVTCLRLAVEVFGGLRESNVGHSTHFYAATVAELPSWARGKTPYCKIGNHLFFADIA